MTKLTSQQRQILVAKVEALYGRQAANEYYLRTLPKEPVAVAKARILVAGFEALRSKHREKVHTSFNAARVGVFATFEFLADAQEAKKFVDGLKPVKVVAND